LRGTPCEVSYQDRKGKYQNQAQEVVYAKAWVWIAITLSKGWTSLKF
jgi:hypothetical protein